MLINIGPMIFSFKLLCNFLNGLFPASFFFVFVFSTVNSKHVHYKIFAFDWIRTADIRCANWATTTAQLLCNYNDVFRNIYKSENSQEWTPTNVEKALNAPPPTIATVTIHNKILTTVLRGSKTYLKSVIRSVEPLPMDSFLYLGHWALW